MKFAFPVLFRVLCSATNTAHCEKSKPNEKSQKILKREMNVSFVLERGTIDNIRRGGRRDGRFL